MKENFHLGNQKVFTSDIYKEIIMLSENLNNKLYISNKEQIER